MNTISRFLRYGARGCILSCVCVGLYSCSPQASSPDTSTQSLATAIKPSGDSINAQMRPKQQDKNTQKSPHKALKAPSDSSPSHSPTQPTNDQAKDTNPKGSQGLKFAYKDLVAPSLEEADYNYTGVVRLYHSNGVLAWEISFKDGKQDGWTKWYYDNGQVRTQMFFIDGNANGESLWYYRHGVVREQGNYANDLANGESKLYTPSGMLKYTIVYRDGKEISRQEYDQKGRVVAQ